MADYQRCIIVVVAVLAGLITTLACLAAEVSVQAILFRVGFAVVGALVITFTLAQLMFRLLQRLQTPNAADPVQQKKDEDKPEFQPLSFNNENQS